MAPAAGKPIPRATYRVQLNGEFGFDRTAAIADYIARLGVSHLYASPYMKARPGSTHGYDIVNHNELNPEVGDQNDFRDLVEALKRNGLGQILDFVPNHMGVGGSDNEWWLNVLEWGPESPYAGYFDIEWESDYRYLQGKVLVPFLGDQYGAVLVSGGLDLRFDPETGSFAVWAYESHKLPVRPQDYGTILGSDHPDLERIGDAFAHLAYARPHQIARAGVQKAELATLVATRPDVADAIAQRLSVFRGYQGEIDSWGHLHELIGRQNWRVAYFKVAADDINYRRFFNINELAGLRMDEPELFDVAHRMVLGMVADGTLDGIRIDHIDGLIDPKGYCERLVAASSKPFYLVVEKILARHERLREDWPIDGTTGYEYANLMGGLFVDPKAEEAFTRLYGDFIGRRDNFEEVVRQCKIRIMESEMASELNVLSRKAARIARSNPATADFTANILHQALKETIARFPVYRTYVDGGVPSDLDRRDIDWAISQARRVEQGPDGSVYDFLQRLLTTDLVAAPKSGYSHRQVTRFAMRFQQYSGPVMAKGLEDTAFYRYNRLVALNEVGGHPDHFGVSVSAFHRANQDRARNWPGNMLASTTHDTKRGEDTRARLYALSEMPEEWERQVQTWSRLLRARRGDVEGTAPPDRNDEYLFYQLLLGAWPAELTGASVDRIEQPAMTAFAERIVGAMTKSMREAKVHSTWAAPNEAYEGAVVSFIHDALDVTRRNAFLEVFLPFQASLARIGMVNGLAQALLKLTSPGVPDIYQGCELWNLSLVDPDNRLPVDYDARRELLEEVEGVVEHGAVAGLLERWTDGAVKLAVTRQALAVRGEMPEVFSAGEYLPLEATGERADHVVAYARRNGDETVVVAVPRLVGQLGENPDWGNTAIPLPRGTGWRNRLTGAEVEGGDAVMAARLFADLPVALLSNKG
ncbi:malto-oligosyltrehalose synthase [Azospirillum melinis]|uniref:Malto-oligosyltrehalose synthase n=1 Tax=Azospirillum melinis TaxID=328839 RepID=A0ABX2KDZ3_9PROT|nr:malto-oligosyltrehalose synthase [Azospirillum melinis]MBP2308792.1 (1->4)-alpha-D-glucan 1-alpha-D-glucosylmutase [Azospirillum melinis]NUA99488.1 malto-oligosyltrehalose synthase [Azospirillum melinis]